MNQESENRCIISLGCAVRRTSCPQRDRAPALRGGNPNPAQAGKAPREQVVNMNATKIARQEIAAKKERQGLFSDRTRTY
jgi:hypothetical protein